MPGVAKVSSIASGTHMYNRRDHENREESGIEKKYQKPESKLSIKFNIKTSTKNIIKSNRKNKVKTNIKMQNQNPS